MGSTAPDREMGTGRPARLGSQLVGKRRDRAMELQGQPVGDRPTPASLPLGLDVHPANSMRPPRADGLHHRFLGGESDRVVAGGSARSPTVLDLCGAEHPTFESLAPLREDALDPSDLDDVDAAADEHLPPRDFNLGFGMLAVTCAPPPSPSDAPIPRQRKRGRPMSLMRNVDSLLADGEISGRRVFLRADLNVPITNGVVTDDTRIRASIPTLRRLLDAGGRVVLASHLGRPKGEPRPELSLSPVADALSVQLERPVAFCGACVGAEAEAAVAALADGEVVLLENLRFDPGETNNEPGFAAQLAALADIYVNDAFGTAHRAHASITGIAALVETRAAGLLLESELTHLRVALEPMRPFLCLLGGSKVSDKLGVLEALAPRADVLAVGGAMAYTFLAAQKHPVGSSLVEPGRFEDAKRVLASAKRLLLPTDHVIAQEIRADAEHRVVATIPEGWMGVDIGPETAARYAEEASRAKTILWNGPMGVFEMEPFAAGTETVARGVADSAASSIVGGGDSLAAINKLALGDRIGHLSTGGGASLEYVQGLELPGIAALEA